MQKRACAYQMKFSKTVAQRDLQSPAYVQYIESSKAYPVYVSIFIAALL